MKTVDWAAFRNEIVRLYALSQSCQTQMDITEQERSEARMIDARLDPLFIAIREAMKDRLLPPPYRIEKDALVLSEDIRLRIEGSWPIAQTAQKLRESLAAQWSREVQDWLSRNGLGVLGEGIQATGAGDRLLKSLHSYVDLGAVKNAVQAHLAQMDPEAVVLCRKAFSRPTWEHYRRVAHDKSKIREALAQGALGADVLYDAPHLAAALSMQGSDDLKDRLRQRSPRYLEHFVGVATDYLNFSGGTAEALFTRFAQTLANVTQRIDELPPVAALEAMPDAEENTLATMIDLYLEGKLSRRFLRSFLAGTVEHAPEAVRREVLLRYQEDSRSFVFAHKLEERKDGVVLLYDRCELRESETDDRFHEYRAGTDIRLRTLRPMSIFKTIRNGFTAQFYFESRVGQAHAQRPDFLPFLDQVVGIAIRCGDPGLLKAILERRAQLAAPRLSLDRIEDKSALDLLTGDRGEILELLRKHCTGQFSSALLRSALQRQCALKVVEHLLDCCEHSPSMELIEAGRGYVYRDKSPRLQAWLENMTLRHEVEAQSAKRIPSRIGRPSL